MLSNRHEKCMWATTWPNQQNECAPSEDYDQPGHPPSLIRVIAVCSVGSLGPKLSSCRQRRLWSDWEDAQADQSSQSLRWAHAQPFCWFGHVAAHVIIVKSISIHYRHNTYLQECTGVRDPSYPFTVHDLKMLLLKFAEEKSFSDESGGGGRQSNIHVLAYVMHMALYVINT